MIQALLGFIPMIGGLISNWQEKKLLQAKGKIEIEAARVKGEVILAEKVAAGDIEYNIEAQKGMQWSWKDEWFVIVWTVILICSFLPWTQPFVQAGFVFLNAHTPWWYSYCLVGMVVASFGLKGWKFWKNGNGNG